MRSIRQTLTVQTSTKTANDLNELIDSWADTTDVTASVAPVSRRERELQGLDVEERVFTIKLPKGLDLDASSNRIQTASDVTWEILDILEAPSVTVCTVREVT